MRLGRIIQCVHAMLVLRFTIGVLGIDHRRHQRSHFRTRALSGQANGKIAADSAETTIYRTRIESPDHLAKSRRLQRRLADCDGYNTALILAIKTIQNS